MYILTLKNLEKQRTSMANWDSLQTIIGHQLQIKKQYASSTMQLVNLSYLHWTNKKYRSRFSIPVSLQFGLVGLANYVPETLQQLRSQINEFETNTKIRANIRKWFEENGELKYVDLMAENVNRIFINYLTKF